VQNAPTLKTYLKTSGSPWLRWGARILDIMVLTALVGAALPNSRSRDLARLEGISVLLVWIPLEALLISRLGFTPGKWLFGLSVLDRGGSRLTFQQALHRAGLVFLRGLGAGILAPFTQAWAFWQIANAGEATWDRDCSSTMVWRRSYARMCVGAILLLAAVHLLTLSRWKALQ
jgi:uncharacterized RDD family membrane protein YckC